MITSRKEGAAEQRVDCSFIEQERGETSRVERYPIGSDGVPAFSEFRSSETIPFDR
jgi:hypothetical protein